MTYIKSAFEMIALKVTKLVEYFYNCVQIFTFNLLAIKTLKFRCLNSYFFCSSNNETKSCHEIKWNKITSAILLDLRKTVCFDQQYNFTLRHWQLVTIQLSFQEIMLKCGCVDVDENCWWEIRKGDFIIYV